MRIKREGTLYQLSFMPRFFPVNCYFVEEEASLTLIDTALPFSYKAILKTSHDIGKPITRIVLTHAHEDHIGSLDRLKGELPNAEVYISRRDARLLSGDKRLERDEPQTPIRGGISTKVKTRANILLQDGEYIGSLLAISTSGHTPGHMAFLDTRNGALLAGDAFQTKTGVTVTSNLKLRFPFPAMATWNNQLTLNSAQKLIDVAPSLLAVGHGRMVKQPIREMKQALFQAKQKEERRNINVT